MHRRRARTLLVSSVVFAAVVLGTSLPVSTLLAQHAQLSSTSKKLAGLEEQNHALQKQASQLSDPSTIADIARLDYELVAPGSQAYEIVPSSGNSTEVAGSDYIPLTGPPVVPGSAQSLRLLGAGAVTATWAGSGEPAASSGSSGTTGRSGRASTATRAAGEGDSTGGFWTRVIHTLEFWR